MRTREREAGFRAAEMFGPTHPHAQGLYNRQDRRAKLTKREAVLEFKRDVLPHVRATYEADGEVDRDARAEAWNNWTDGLCKLGRITQEQYDTWEGPW
jgi:hypothetical protein